jgi:hypothetical protein
MQGLIRFARQLAALGALLTLGASCTTHVTVKPLDLPEAHGTRIRASIGVYYTDEFTTHPVREQLVVEYDSIALETDIGPASRSAFGATLDSAFEEVIEVDSANPAELVGGRINVVAVPRILDFDYRQVPGDTFVDVTYELELLHRDGRTLTIRAAGHDATDPGNPLGIELLPTAAPRKIAAAIRSASATLWLRLNSVADEDDWFSALAELEEIDHEESSGKAVAGDGPCVVSLFLEDFGYYDEY